MTTNPEIIDFVKRTKELKSKFNQIKVIVNQFKEFHKDTNTGNLLLHQVASRSIISLNKQVVEEYSKDFMDECNEYFTLELIVSKYIKDIVIDKQHHYLLVMDEFNILEKYSKEKYCILEVLQDIDQHNKDNNIDTSYYERYCSKYMTFKNF
mgnify:CR=1 FL=1